MTGNMREIFLKAVFHLLTGKWGEKARLSRETGIDVGYLNRILSGKAPGSDSNRRAIAVALGYPGARYEDFLNIGRALLAGKEPPAAEPPQPLTADEMSERGFFVVPFSDNMKLAAGSGGRIPVTDDEESSRIIIHGPSLRRHNAKKLQAFRVGGDSMEPVIAKGGIVLADLKQSDIRHIHEGGIYVLCWDLSDGECAVKRLRWAEKGKWLSIESEEKFYAPVVKRPQEVMLIGRVIWSWREH